MMKYYAYITFLLALVTGTVTFAQDKPVGIPVIQELIDAKKYKEAEILLQKNIRYFVAEKNIDTLIRHVSLQGRVTYGLKGANAAIAGVYAYLEMLKEQKASPRQLSRAYYYGSFFFYTINEYHEAYKCSQLRLKIAKEIRPVSNSIIADAHYYLGEYASRFGDFDLALNHQRTAYSITTNDKNATPASLYQSANAMSKLMLELSNPDSASFYCRISQDVLSKLPPTNENKYHNAALINKDLAIISNMIGQSDDAIRYSYNAINLLRQYINSKESRFKDNAKFDLNTTIENLSVFYSQLGNIGRANDLLRYTYESKKAMLLENDPAILGTEVLLGSNYNNIGDYDNARYFLSNAIRRANLVDGGALLSVADAWYVMATVNANTKKMIEAKKGYLIADSLYAIAQQDMYSDMYLDFVRSLCLFCAQNGLPEKAISKASRVYQHLRSTGKTNTLQGFYQAVNVAMVYYHTNRYKDAIRYSNEALEIVNEKLKKGKSKLDSIKWEAYKPQCIVTNAMSQYQMQSRKNITFLKNIQATVDSALQILEHRKGTLDDAESINSLIECNRTLIDFSKKIAIELHRLSGNQADLEKFVNMHESALYSRIRSRLDQEHAVNFSHVPMQVLAEERRLKESIKAFGSEERNGNGIKDYLQTVKLWEEHLEMVQNKYPDYYNLRYATLFKSLPKLQSAIPARTTLIRYYFIDSTLVALIADRQSQKIIELSSFELEEKVQKFLLHNAREEEQLKLLYELYVQLWAPLASSVKTEKVIVVPDGILYNIGFDMLPFAPVDNYKQLRTKSLLAKHTIAYHYNLFMLEAQNREASATGNYVAFAPGFSDELKKKYTNNVRDSLKMDRNYLTLLPQPTANAITRKIRELIGGDIYLENESTQASFRRHAGNHRIIHIATHAEYNNNCPERSGLIFAKDASGNDSNYIYLTDIYNCNLNSDVTVLTACESGRPGLQDGEGMVSLAHAFNYAGSRNILTALWKIDEKVSSQITESFIQYLKDGMPTDEALRQAKLDYLEKADGRLADPGYWSGLVLMGKPLTVDFSDEVDFPSGWMAVGTLFLSGALLFVSVRRRRRAA